MARDVRNPLLGAFACLLALAPVAALAYWIDPAERLDARVLRQIAALDHGAVHSLAAAVTALGELPALLGILALIVGIGFALGRRREAVAAVVIVVGANLTTQLLKQLMEHARMQAELRGYEIPWADSFPSGHTTAAASLAVGLVLVVSARQRPLALVVGAGFTAAMGLAVVVLQWHYPSDVLGGLLVVGAWSLGAVAALRALRERPAEQPPDRRETSSADFAVSLR